MENENTKVKIFNIIIKVIHYIFYGIFGVIFLITIWIAFDKFILKSSVPSIFGYATLTIETGSMNGTSVMVEGKDPVKVSEHDLILIKKTNDYKIGDVITFIHEGEKIPTTHRIVGRTDDGYLTKGDANNTSDTQIVLEEEILGEVIGHYPKLGRVVTWIKKEGWIYMVGGLAVLAIGIFLLKFLDDDESKPKDKDASIEE